MGTFETVTIEPRGAHYEVHQGGRLLFRVPRDVFHRYEPDAVFPPLWKAREEEHPVRRLYWDPRSRELLMAGLEAHPARTAELYGSSPFRSFLQALWIPRPPVLLVRPFWNPADPREPFGPEAREENFRIQTEFLEILSRLRAPRAWAAVLNATQPYLEALGADPPLHPEPGAVHEISLTPPASLEDPAPREALRRFAVDHAGLLFPVVRPGLLVGIHALSLPACHVAEAVLRDLDLLYQEGPYRPH